MSASGNMENARVERIAARTTGLAIPADAARDLVRYTVWAAYRGAERYVRDRVDVPVPFVGRWIRRLIEDVLEVVVGMEPVDLINVADDPGGDIVLDFPFPPPEPPAPAGPTFPEAA